MSQMRDLATAINLPFLFDRLEWCLKGENWELDYTGSYPS